MQACNNMAQKGREDEKVLAPPVLHLVAHRCNRIHGLPCIVSRFPFPACSPIVHLLPCLPVRLPAPGRYPQSPGVACIPSDGLGGYLFASSFRPVSIGFLTLSPKRDIVFSEPETTTTATASGSELEQATGTIWRPLPQGTTANHGKATAFRPSIVVVQRSA